MKNNFQREELQAPLSEINMTPMVDIMLVLLVIFLITAPIINSAINVNLPKENAKIISEEKAITISINKEGRFFFRRSRNEFRRFIKSFTKNIFGKSSTNDTSQS